MRAAALVGLLLWTTCLAVAAEERVAHIDVYKAERSLVLRSQDGAVVRRYRVALGGNPVGHKERQGDERTPEGRYVIDGRNAESGFHRALHISYPSAADRAAAAKSGVNPGGAIMIHGIRNGYGWVGFLHRLIDWTDGCIAVTDREMDEIWSLVEIGTPIEIHP